MLFSSYSNLKPHISFAMRREIQTLRQIIKLRGLTMLRVGGTIFEVRRKQVEVKIEGSLGVIRKRIL
ncbi:hypothetical protein BJP49_12665 [Paenibacillus odorifer]|nr:hypothetical protein BJP49_12665 [Paenibacillus odorifer]